MRGEHCGRCEGSTQLKDNTEQHFPSSGVAQVPFN